MGRHSAPAPVVEPNPLDAAAPITDPRLFDSPLAPVGRSSQVVPITAPHLTERAPVARPLRPAAPAAARTLIAAEADTAPSRPAPRAVATLPSTSPLHAWDVDEDVADTTVGSQHFAPVSVRSTPLRGEDRLVPRTASGSLLGQGPSRPKQQRYLRTGPIPVVEDEEERRAPTTFTRKREAALAAAALAVVGAMSGAAALLPSNSSDAQAATRLQPVSSPAPQASGATTGVFCLSPVQLKRAMQHHHHHRKPIRGVVAAPAIAEPSKAPSSSAAPSPSSSASPSASASSSPSTSPSNPSGGSKPTSTAPLIDLPALVGALPMIPSNLAEGLYSLRDFGTQSSGAVIAGGKLHGDGVGKTVVAMTQNSSTKAGVVPGNGNNQGGLANPVNPLYLLRGVSDLQDVTVQGTQQGHLYNGLYMTGPNLVIKHVQVNDIPGNSNANPGETFAIGVNRASGHGTVDDLTINGGTGALSSSAGLAINNSDANWDIDDLTTKNLKYSAGIALWQTRGTMNIRNFVQKGGARALGAERVASTVNLFDPKWDAGTTGHDVTYTWDGGYSGGSINFYYSSASQVPSRKINIITNKASGIANSVRVFIGGVQQQTSKYVTVN